MQNVLGSTSLHSFQACDILEVSKAGNSKINVISLMMYNIIDIS